MDNTHALLVAANGPPSFIPRPPPPLCPSNTYCRTFENARVNPMPRRAGPWDSTDQTRPQPQRACSNRGVVRRPLRRHGRTENAFLYYIVSGHWWGTEWCWTVLMSRKSVSWSRLHGVCMGRSGTSAHAVYAIFSHFCYVGGFGNLGDPVVPTLRGVSGDVVTVCAY